MQISMPRVETTTRVERDKKHSFPKNLNERSYIFLRAALSHITEITSITTNCYHFMFLFVLMGRQDWEGKVV